MACVNATKTTVSAPLGGAPIVLEFRINEQTCKVHINGAVDSCIFTDYRKACCCGNENVGFEVPILGYNTTTSVYAECNGDGLIPVINPIPTATQPYPHTTQTIGLPPKTTSNNGSRMRVGLVLWLATFAVATLRIF